MLLCAKRQNFTETNLKTGLEEDNFMQTNKSYSNSRKFAAFCLPNLVLLLKHKTAFFCDEIYIW